MKIPVQRTDSGLTLLEILISLLIFGLVLTGLSNIFVVSRRYLFHSRARVAATEAGKFLLSPLYSDVRQDSFDSGNLSVTSPTRAGDTVSLNGIQFDSTFAISNTLGGDLRKVNVLIHWNETSP